LPAAVTAAVAAADDSVSPAFRHASQLTVVVIRRARTECVVGRRQPRQAVPPRQGVLLHRRPLVKDDRQQPAHRHAGRDPRHVYGHLPEQLGGPFGLRQAVKLRASCGACVCSDEAVRRSSGNVSGGRVAAALNHGNAAASAHQSVGSTSLTAWHACGSVVGWYEHHCCFALGLCPCCCVHPTRCCLSGTRWIPQ